ncbi:restriction endonuclease subunit S [uncultured Polaribacter sp.]|uniref:restriction endonuclease subunit S n=1 Tax=uncultured Polaribacter sp. TaxID=174711 RepID=UPI0026190526|nr:restriction endonuclease subunit S [uncultured Polaribacter sp.]
MMEKQLIPQLRFPEFEGGWKSLKIGNIGKPSMCKRIMKDQTLNVGDIPFYKIGTFGKEADAYISNDLYEEYKTKFSFPKKGDILISASGTIGRTVIYDGKPAYFQDSNIVWIANNEEKVLNKLLVYLYENVRWTTENTTIARLYNDNLKSINITIPSLPEQQKIASFLTDVDAKITKLTKKKDLLEQYKKGIMQKIFNQELRFKDNNGNAFPRWNVKTLGGIASINMGQSPESSTYNSDGNGYYLIQGNADISNRKTTPRNWTSNPTKLCDIGDLILTVRAPVGAVAKSNHKACIGRGVCSIKNKALSNIEFIYQFLLDYEKRWARLEQGSTFTAVSGKDIKSIEINLPSIEEQTKIANFLSDIDLKIEALNTQIENSKAFKKGLLQKMFV